MIKGKPGVWFLLCLLGIWAMPVHAQISVHPGKRFLVDKNGKPFFWLGDTAWELPHRIDRAEIEIYLETRHRQGFNVIQIVALPFASARDNSRPNRYGDYPFIDNNPDKPATTPGSDPIRADQYDYWDHIDFVFKLAAEKGLYIAFNPVWGDHVSSHFSPSGVIFDQDNALRYGRFIGSRYGKQWNVVWVMGGDAPVTYETKDHVRHDDAPVWQAMVQGIKEGEGTNHHLMTYHPKGGVSSSQFFHKEPWMDINTFQSSHGSRNDDARKWVEQDLALLPSKPTMDMEPCYEDHPINPWDGKWKRQRGYFSAHDVRSRIYRGILAGGCGVTYGHQQVWQFVNTDLFEPLSVGDTIIGWRKALTSEAAGQMQYLTELVLSKPYFSRIPDQSLLPEVAPDDKTVIAARDTGGGYAFVYLSESKPVTIDLAKLSANGKRAIWFDPRTGRKQHDPWKGTTGKVTFNPPVVASDPKVTDWILIIEDSK